MNAFPDKPNVAPDSPATQAEVSPVQPAGSLFDAGLTPAPTEPAILTLPGDPAWTIWDVLRILLMGIVAFFLIAAILVVSMPGASPRDRVTALSAHLELQILGQMATYLLMLGYMYVLVTRERRQPSFWRALHWNWPERAWIYLLLGLLLQAVFMVIESFLPFPKEVPFDVLLKKPFSIALVGVFAVSLGPLIEALFFRGFLYPVLRLKAGVGAAVVATAFPFALLHAAQYGYSWASVSLIFGVGVLLAVVRENYDSLAASFLVHIGYNGTIMLILFGATGGFRHLEKLNQ